MKKLLPAAVMALCMPLAAVAQVTGYADVDPNTGARITREDSPQSPHPVRGQTVIVGGGTITTPAGTTGYDTTTPKNLIANSATNTLVTPYVFTGACLVQGGNGAIVGGRLKTADTGFAGKTVFLELYKNLPTFTNGDHGAWLTTESEHIGTVSIVLGKTFSDFVKGRGAPVDAASTPNAESLMGFDCAVGSTAIYGVEVAGSSITPQGAKAHSPAIEVLH